MSNIGYHIKVLVNNNCRYRGAEEWYEKIGDRKAGYIGRGKPSGRNIGLGGFWKISSDLMRAWYYDGDRRNEDVLDFSLTHRNDSIGWISGWKKAKPVQLWRYFGVPCRVTANLSEEVTAGIVSI